MVFPWQLNQWQHLLALKQANRLPHALLFSGIVGLGKAKFADEFTSALLCDHPAQTTISDCHSCRLISNRTHPNALWIQPEQTGHAIKIEQIRSVSEFVQQTTLQGKYKVVVIHSAHAMNVQAANALLKTLEEPSPDTLIMLISDQSGRLPATILSRCQRLLFAAPDQQVGLAWLKQQLPGTDSDVGLLLQLAQGAPLAALQLQQANILAIRAEILPGLSLLSTKQENPIKLAEKWQALDVLVLLDCMFSWLLDILRLQLGGEINGVVNKDYAAQLINLEKQTNSDHNVKLLTVLQRLRRQINLGVNLIKQLMIESILTQW